MKNTKFEKVYKDGYENRDKFRKLSDYIVEHYVSNTTEENKVVVSECASIDMAMGAEFKKKEYLLTGILIGVIITIIGLGLIKIFL